MTSMTSKCPECGKDISPEAEECPKCGYPLISPSSEASAGQQMDSDSDRNDKASEDVSEIVDENIEKAHIKSDNKENAEIQETSENPVYKQWWFWATIAVLVLIIVLIVSCTSSNNSAEQKSSSSTAKSVAVKTVKSFGASYHGFFTNLVLAGEAPKKEEFKATLFYTDGSSEEVADFTIEPNEFNPIGNGESAVYTIKYKDYEKTVTVQGVTVVRLSAKYESDTSYLFISAELSNGQNVAVDSGYSVSDPVVNGNEETVTVSFGGKTATATRTKKSTGSADSSSKHDSGTYSGTTPSVTAPNYKIGEYVNVTGKVIKKASNSFTLEKDGIEYKCFPPNTGVIEYISIGKTMDVRGKVLSKSKMSINLENVDFSDYGR